METVWSTRMIPIWLTIPCIIVCLIVIAIWLLEKDIDWLEVLINAKDIVISMIIISCFIVVIFSIIQLFTW